MQASSFLLNIHHQPLSTSSTTINNNHPYHQQPYQYPQHNPKTSKDLRKIATSRKPKLCDDLTDCN